MAYFLTCLECALVGSSLEKYVAFKYSTCSRQNRLVHPQQYCIIKVYYTVNSTTAISSPGIRHVIIFFTNQDSFLRGFIPLAIIMTDDSSLE